MRLPGASPCGLARGPLLLGLCGILTASRLQLVREGLGGMGQAGMGAWADFAPALLPTTADPALFSSVSASPRKVPPYRIENQTCWDQDKEYYESKHQVCCSRCPPGENSGPGKPGWLR